jgi:hypothetical protein
MPKLKSLSTTFTPRERYAVWFHLSRNISTSSTREQDQFADVWESLLLDAYDADTRAAKLEGKSIEPEDYGTDTTISVELARDELSYLLGLLVRPMPAVLSLLLRPVRRRLSEERDRAGVNAPADEPDEGA